MRQGTQGQWPGMTLRDGMGREVGMGFRMGNTCTPVADACWCMAKPIQYCKVKKKMLYISHPGPEYENVKLSKNVSLSQSKKKKKKQKSETKI